MTKRFLLLTTVLMVFFPALCQASVIRVADQASFDGLGEAVQREIKKGEKDIRIEILPGHYFYSEGHITIANSKSGDVSLTIVGDRAVLSGACTKSEFDLKAGFIDLEKGTAAPLFREMKQALSTAEILDEKTGLCRMAVDEKAVKPKRAADMYILITQWYSAKYYPVREIKDGYVYFSAPGATDKANAQTSPNADYHYGKKLPRYALLNHPKTRDCPVYKKGRIRAPSGCRILRCDAATFLAVRGGELRSVKVSGIKFLGSGGTDPVINLYRCNLREGAVVSDCVFDGIKGDVIWIVNAPSVSFTGNVVKNCHATGVSSTPGTKYTVVKGNKFYNNGLDVNNYFCVKCLGIDFLIADNYFEDFTYGAIEVGIWYATNDLHPCSGVIENNECCLSEQFTSGVYRNLMDSGAIYTCTINTDVTIRKNYIHDISGPGDNRGIFCDDGTVNVKILSNRVERIANSYCIDLRRVLSIETAPGTKIKRVNVGNVMKDNIVDGKVRFEQRDK